MTQLQKTIKSNKKNYCKSRNQDIYMMYNKNMEEYKKLLGTISQRDIDKNQETVEKFIKFRNNYEKLYCTDV